MKLELTGRTFKKVKRLLETPLDQRGDGVWQISGIALGDDEDRVFELLGTPSEHGSRSRWARPGTYAAFPLATGVVSAELRALNSRTAIVVAFDSSGLVVSVETGPRYAVASMGIEDDSLDAIYQWAVRHDPECDVGANASFWGAWLPGASLHFYGVVDVTRTVRSNCISAQLITTAELEVKRGTMAGLYSWTAPLPVNDVHTT